MPGNPHPASEVFGAGNVAKADVIADDKLKNRRVGSADDIRNGDWSGQFGKLFVAALGYDFQLDTEDTTSIDDGTNTIIDANGLRFKKIAVSVSIPERTITASGAVTGAATDNIVLVNKSADETTDYNAVASASLIAEEITLKDLKGDASTYRLRFVPNGAEKVDGEDYFDITRNHGWVTVRKKSGGGWYVKSSSE
jgi:hypothetical protein